MKTSTDDFLNECCQSLLPTLIVIARAAVAEARQSPERFVELCFPGPAGEPTRPAAIHRELQEFLKTHSRALVELPRDHGKSTQVCGRIVWELGHNPALRVRLVCATDKLAVERGRFVREAVADNPLVRWVFPDLRPGKPWAAHSFTVQRPASAIGPSVSAFGTGSGATGARADLLICDDIVDVRALHSAAERERVKTDFQNNLMNLLEPDGRFWGLCTPWHADDLNAVLKSSTAYKLYRRAVGPNLEPVWPEKWPTERLAARKAEIGSSSFARGYHLVPIDPGEVAVRPEWVKLWHDALPRRAFERVVLAIDPAVSSAKSADRSALVVLGRVAGTNEVHCLETGAHRVAAPELVDLIDAADRRWQPDTILFESTAAFQGIKDMLSTLTSFGARVVGVKPKRAKGARVAGFSVPVQNGLFRLRGDVQGGVDSGQRELFEEMTTFPYASHDDLLDAAAMGNEFLHARPEPRIWLM